MNAADIIALMALSATLGITLAGVIYQGGRLAARVETLESWRGEMKLELNAIHDGIRRVETAINHERT